ncbi:MAG TPA: hypothetical protein VM389_14225 [Phycisphaerae bacterium]|nr:hypothetical protein [Phycisphaerae bacterium]
MAGKLKSMYLWAVRRPGYLLLAGDGDRLAAEDPKRFAHAWIGLMLLSLGWGLVCVALWAAAWHLFVDYSRMFFMPVAFVVTGMVLGLYRRALLALGEAFSGGDPRAAPLLSCAGVVFLVLVLLGLKTGSGPHYETPLLPAWQWVRPAPMFRALLLGPLWGGWAMLIVPQFCRPNGRTEPAVAAFATGCGALVAAGCMGAVAAATTLYFNYMPWWQLSISGAAIITAILCGVAFCKLNGGLDRRSLLAANLLTQMVFLSAYLVNRCRAGL